MLHCLKGVWKSMSKKLPRGLLLSHAPGQHEGDIIYINLQYFCFAFWGRHTYSSQSSQSGSGEIILSLLVLLGGVMFGRFAGEAEGTSLRANTSSSGFCLTESGTSANDAKLNT
ncbi:hypothetical protein FOCC_FOCC015217, partial [Frankliniella occidentalis]